MTHQETMLPVTFHALVVKQPGAPVSLQQKTIASQKKDEVLIRVNYASINNMDPQLARANHFHLPLPYVLGFDFSGEVVRLGGGGFQVGDQVFGGSIAGGGFAEYVRHRLRDRLRVPGDHRQGRGAKMQMGGPGRYSFDPPDCTGP